MVVIKDILANVIGNANTLLQADANSWYVQNGKQLNSLIGINPFIIESLKNAPAYPSCVVIQPFFEDTNEYISVTIPKMVIVAEYDEKDNLSDRYNTTFKPVLYPTLDAFLTALVQYSGVIESDTSQVRFGKEDVPGWQPADSQLENYLDAIVLNNVKFSIISH